MGLKIDLGNSPLIIEQALLKNPTLNQVLVKCSQNEKTRLSFNYDNSIHSIRNRFRNWYSKIFMKMGGNWTRLLWHEFRSAVHMLCHIGTDLPWNRTCNTSRLAYPFPILTVMYEVISGMCINGFNLEEALEDFLLSLLSGFHHGIQAIGDFFQLYKG